MSKLSKSDWAKVEALTDEQAERNAAGDPEAQPTDAGFWADAEFRGPVARKIPVHIRLDPEVLAWFKKGGPGYQSRINQVLESFVLHQKTKGQPRA